MNAGDIADLSRMTLNNDGMLGSAMPAPFEKESESAKDAYDPFPALPTSDRLGSHPPSLGSALLTPQMIQPSRPNAGFPGFPASDDRLEHFEFFFGTQNAFKSMFMCTNGSAHHHACLTHAALIAAHLS